MATWHRPNIVRTNHAQFELIHVEPSDIKLVAVSHTHPDHAGNIEMFATRPSRHLREGGQHEPQFLR